MNDELNTLGRCDAHLEHPPRRVCAEDHRQVIEFEYSYRVTVRVQDVDVGYPVFASTLKDNRVHRINIS